jgi:hypothetical protein
VSDTPSGGLPNTKASGNLVGVLDDELLSGIINLLMRIDANVQLLVDAWTEEDDDEEPDA